MPGSPGKRKFVASLGVAVYEAHTRPLDLSTEVVVRTLNGQILDVIQTPIVIPAQDPYTCGGLGCLSGPCGTGMLHGDKVQMICKYSQQFPDCGCQLPWDTSCQELHCAFDGDLVFEIRPSDGALPELDLRADLLRCPVGAKPEAPSVETAYWSDFEHEALGSARIQRDAQTLTFKDLGDSGEDGLAVRFPPADAFGVKWLAPRKDPGDAVEIKISTQTSAEVSGKGAQWIPSVSISRDPTLARFEVGLSPKLTGKAGFEIDYLLGEKIVHTSAVGLSPARTVNDLIWPVGVQQCAIFWCRNGGCYLVSFEEPTEFDLGRQSLKADTVRLRPSDPPSPPHVLLSLAITTQGLGSLQLVSEEHHAALEPAPKFRRGDVNQDFKVDISDGIRMLDYLFLGGESPACLDATDANDDGLVQISDAVTIFAFLFSGGSAPPSPGSFECGSDPTDDSLDCESYKCTP